MFGTGSSNLQLYTETLIKFQMHIQHYKACVILFENESVKPKL